MPVTPWREMIGKTCQICGGAATHYYGNLVICCSCHAGEKDGGLFSDEEAMRMHAEELAAINSLSNLVKKG